MQQNLKITSCLIKVKLTLIGGEGAVFLGFNGLIPFVIHCYIDENLNFAPVRSKHASSMIKFFTYLDSIWIFKNQLKIDRS